MIKILASMFHTEPAVVWVVLVIAFIFLAIAFANANRKGPDYVYSGNPLVDSVNKRLADFEFVEHMGDVGKKIYKAIANAIIQGTGGKGAYVMIFVFLLIVGFSLYGLLDYVGAVKSQPAVVGPGETCVRQGIALSEGTTLQAWDICNGKVIEPTAIPTILAPTQAPTQTPFPTTFFTPGAVEILSSATPAVAEEDNYPILTVKSGGITGIIGGWSNISASALSASQVVESKTCDLVGFGEKTKPQFIVPSWAQSAYLVFYEPNSLWEVTNTQLTISGDTITITLCKEDIVFELFAY